MQGRMLLSAEVLFWSANAFQEACDIKALERHIATADKNRVGEMSRGSIAARANA